MLLEKIIEFRDQEEATRLFGIYDRHLKFIRENTGAKLVARNGALQIWGSRASVEKAYRALTHLQGILKRKREIEPDDLSAAVGIAPETNPSTNPRTARTFRPHTTVEPKSPGQTSYLAEIEQNDLIFSIGPAGTGKTFLAVAKAVEYLKQGRVRRLVLTRPAVEAGERLGFLPGDIQAKVNPYLRPIYDALNHFLEFGQLKRLIENDIVEIVPLAFMRGRTLEEAFIILDEAQNTTHAQMKMFLTRMGEKSKIVITGDITQIDLPAGVNSGLVEAQNFLKGIPNISFAYLTKEDIVRHPLVEKIVDAYEGYGRGEMRK